MLFLPFDVLYRVLNGIDNRGSGFIGESYQFLRPVALPAEAQKCYTADWFALPAMSAGDCKACGISSAIPRPWPSLNTSRAGSISATLTCSPGLHRLASERWHWLLHKPSSAPQNRPARRTAPRSE